MMEHATTLLRDTFHVPSFRPGQQEAIERLLKGESALVVFPTGSGKSLCYQLPALMFDGLTVIVSPLIALMKDQVDRLQSLGIAAARLDSSLDGAEVLELYRRLEQNEIRLLYIAPERMANERFLARLRRLKISLLAVDEAHCVSEWGHNFRPDYLKLADTAKHLEVERILALTATATPEVAKQICQSFDIAPAGFIQTGFYRPNLALKVTSCTAAERPQRLLHSLQQRVDHPTIIYVTLQKTAATLAAYLTQQGITAQAYHAGLKDEQRTDVQDAFMNGAINTIVATIAFGMGIDKADIRGIYHYNLPKSLENYMQEIGRAGRDGHPAHCEMLACPDDLTVLENFSYGDTPTASALAGLIQWLVQQPPVFNVSVYELSQTWDIRPLVINTLLTYLELEGVVKATGPFYAEYKIAPKMTTEQIAARFDANRADFLRKLFGCAKQGRTWLTLAPANAATELDTQESRIRAALEYLSDQQLVELKVAGVRQGYRLLDFQNDLAALVDVIQQRFAIRETRDIERLQQVCQWAQSEQCLQRGLLHYFGEALPEPCGHCSVCQGSSAQLKERQTGELNMTDLKTVINQLKPDLPEARQLARFCCGISSPKISRAKLQKNSAFGLYAEVPFNRVLKACNLILTNESLPMRKGRPLDEEG